MTREEMKERAVHLMMAKRLHCSQAVLVAGQEKLGKRISTPGLKNRVQGSRFYAVDLYVDKDAIFVPQSAAKAVAKRTAGAEQRVSQG